MTVTCDDTGFADEATARVAEGGHDGGVATPLAVGLFKRIVAIGINHVNLALCGGRRGRASSSRVEHGTLQMR